MMPIVRKAHKWIALVLGIQLALWVLSGLGMAILPHDRVAGEHRRVEPAAPTPLADLMDREIGQPSAGSAEGFRQIRLRTLNGRAVFDVATANGSVLTDASTGEAITIDQRLATEIALNDYSGPGDITGASLLSESTLEFRDHAAPAWRIDFSDPERTSIYVSASDGQILERRNHYWRTFDIFWMIHIMDYLDRSSFNHPLIVISALIVLWLGVSGIALWWDSFRRNDFNVLGRWRTRRQTFDLSLTDSEGGPVTTVKARPMQSLFAAIGDQGYPLPSTCGGGGTCGLCRVRIGTELPILPADCRQIPGPELASGYRLACQHQVSAPLCVALPHGLLDARDLEGSIVSSNFITPDMYELRIRLSRSLDFRAGSYIQVEIPPFTSDLDHLDLPTHVRAQWEASGTARAFGTDETTYRTYSLANAPGEYGNDILLNIRLALAKRDTPGAPVGTGSAFLTTLDAGEKVKLHGPFGDFHVGDEAGDDELVFIGGGAGIAPLRSIIIDQLGRKGRTTPMTFWYGVRTQDHIVYRDDFDRLAQAHPNFSWTLALSDPAEIEGWAGHHGMIHEIVRDYYLASHPDIAKCSFYICGPPAMLEAVLTLLKSRGVPDEKIAFDDFGN